MANINQIQVESTTYDIEDTTARDDIGTINGKIPSSASSSNKMATASDITSITEKIPSNASSSNKLATASDIPSVTGKADKVSGATNGNFASLDSNGNLADSGYKHGDYLTSIPTASTETLGGVKVDGSSITINNGVISSHSSGGASALNDLSDVTISNPDQNNLLMYVTGIGWVNSSLSLQGLADVDKSTSPTDGQIIKYDSSDHKWVFGYPQIDNVNYSSPYCKNGAILYYNPSTGVYDFTSRVEIPLTNRQGAPIGKPIEYTATNRMIYKGTTLIEASDFNTWTGYSVMVYDDYLESVPSTYNVPCASIIPDESYITITNSDVVSFSPIDYVPSASNYDNDGVMKDVSQIIRLYYQIYHKGVYLRLRILTDGTFPSNATIRLTYVYVK